MKKESQSPWIEPELEARIVALILGESSDFEREELNRLIEEQPGLAAFKDEIQSVHGLLQDIGTGVDDDWKLSSKNRAAVLSVIDGEVRPHSPKYAANKIVTQRKWLSSFTKIAAVFCFVGFFGSMMMRTASINHRLSDAAGQLAWHDTTTNATRNKGVETRESGNENLALPSLSVLDSTSVRQNSKTDSPTVAKSLQDNIPKSTNGDHTTAFPDTEFDLSRESESLATYPKRQQAASMDGLLTPRVQEGSRSGAQRSIGFGLVDANESATRVSPEVQLQDGQSSLFGGVELQQLAEAREEAPADSSRKPSVDWETGNGVVVAPIDAGETNRAGNRRFLSDQESVLDSEIDGVRDLDFDVKSLEIREAPQSGGAQFASPGDRPESLRTGVHELDVMQESLNRNVRGQSAKDRASSLPTRGLEAKTSAERQPQNQMSIVSGLSNDVKRSAERTPSQNEAALDKRFSTRRSDTARSDTARSNTARSNTAHSNTAHSNTAHSNTAHSNTAHSNTARSDTAQSEEVRFESEKVSDGKENPAKDATSLGEGIAFPDMRASDEGLYDSTPDGVTIGQKFDSSVSSRFGEGDHSRPFGLDDASDSSRQKSIVPSEATASKQNVADPSDLQQRVKDSLGKLSTLSQYHYQTGKDPFTHTDDGRHADPNQDPSKPAVRQRGSERYLQEHAATGLSDWRMPADLNRENTPLPVESAPVNKLAVPIGLGEVAADVEAFSTFSLHVSDVSFKLAQAALARGEWPDASQIRVEEFVNAFDYGDPMPSQSEKVACRLEQCVHPFLQQRNLLRVSLRTAAAGRSSNVPLRLTLVLDNSGSMERPDRQQTVRRAFALLAGHLTSIDQVTVISFARQPRLLADRVSGDRSGQLMKLIDRLPSEGGTNIQAALQLAYEKALEQQVANAQNRVILLTDGAVNLGEANPKTLSQVILSMRNAGIAFDAAGISAAGLNDEILEALTRRGDGRYYLLDSSEAVDDGFARQLAGALRPSAKNVKVQVEFNPKRVGHYKLLGFEKHRLKKEDFRNDKVDAAELAAAEAGVAVYQFEAKPDGEGDVGSVTVRFRDLSTGQMIENHWPIPFQTYIPRSDEAVSAVRIATTAALFASKLQGDPLGETVDLKTLSELLSSLPDQERSTSRVQILQTMIEQARELDGH